MKNLNEINVMEIKQSEKVEITGGGFWVPIVIQLAIGAAVFMFNEGKRDAGRC